MRANSTIVCVLLAAIAGCGGSVDPNAEVARANSRNIQRLSNLYIAFQMDHEWRGPADEAKFKAFIRSFDSAKLQRIGIDPAAIDELFVSDRDNEPFKIRYNVKGSAMGSSEPVVFEAVGDDGQREVGFLNMTQREVEPGEYETLWSGKAPATPQRPR